MEHKNGLKVNKVEEINNKNNTQGMNCFFKESYAESSAILGNIRQALAMWESHTQEGMPGWNRDYLRLRAELSQGG